MARILSSCLSPSKLPKAGNHVQLRRRSLVGATRTSERKRGGKRQRPLPWGLSCDFLVVIVLPLRSQHPVISMPPSEGIVSGCRGWLARRSLAWYKCGQPGVVWRLSVPKKRSKETTNHCHLHAHHAQGSPGSHALPRHTTFIMPGPGHGPGGPTARCFMRPANDLLPCFFPSPFSRPAQQQAKRHRQPTNRPRRPSRHDHAST